MYVYIYREREREIERDIYICREIDGYRKTSRYRRVSDHLDGMP